MKRSQAAIGADDVRLVPNTEYAAMIGVSTRTLYSYEVQGILTPAKRINGRKYRDPRERPRSQVFEEGATVTTDQKRDEQIAVLTRRVECLEGWLRCLSNDLDNRGVNERPRGRERTRPKVNFEALRKMK